jgi:hypothetical protein
MEDGWRAFSEVYLMPRAQEAARRARVRQRFAATIRRVIVGRRAVREILSYFLVFSDFGAWWPLAKWRRFRLYVMPDQF